MVTTVDVGSILLSSQNEIVKDPSYGTCNPSHWVVFCTFSFAILMGGNHIARLGRASKTGYIWLWIQTAWVTKPIFYLDIQYPTRFHQEIHRIRVCSLVGASARAKHGR